MRVLVIGLGTPRGEDAVGLLVAERLARSPLPAGVSVATCQRPLDLLERLGDAEAVVLVDAVCSGAEPGTLHRLQAGDLARARGLSTHALGVAEALCLAAALGRTPPHLVLLGIEVPPPSGERPPLPGSDGDGDGDGDFGGMSPAVQRAAGKTAAKIGAALGALASRRRAR